MFQSLRNKLIFLYTISTGLILVIVILVLLMFTEKELVQKRLETFQNHMDIISNKLQFENTINDAWLSQFEMKNNLIVYIEDNGNPLKFPGVLNTPTERSQLLDQLTALALKEGINVSSNHIFTNLNKSSVFTIEEPKGDFYYGCAEIIPTASGRRSLLLLQYLPDYNSSVRNQRILFLVFGSVGILALFIVSSFLVSKMLKPMEENTRKQIRFIAAASHELRSPLSVISANNAAISDTSPQAEKFQAVIDKECKRMARLVDDMLLLASIDAKSWIIKKEPVETDTLLLESYEAFLPLYEQKKINLTLDLPEDELPNIIGDKERLKQVLSILLDNALSYTPTCKNVILRGFALNTHLILEVEDQGIGISDANKKLIFDRFYRADQSRNDKQHFGLGLCIAKELVHLHGGKISVRDAVGGGAIFGIRL